MSHHQSDRLPPPDPLPDTKSGSPPAQDLAPWLESRSVQAWLRGLSAGLLIFGSIWILPAGDFNQPTLMPQFWTGMGLMSLGFVISWGIRSMNGLWFWAIALISRLLLLQLYPGNDIWRYLWEGYLQVNGFSPYHLAPNAPELIPYRTDWWSLINHPTVSAIYPPITQLGFRSLATLAPQVWLFKTAFVAADLAICGLLSRRFGYAQTLLYAWNPLILYSFAGGGHYDSWFLLPLVGAWFFIDHPTDKSDRSPAATPLNLKLALLSSCLLGISVAVKWMSLPILAFLSWRSLQSRLSRQTLGLACLVGMIGLMPLLLSALPFCQPSACPLIPTSSTFVSHGRSAEFIPYFVGNLWPMTRTANWPFLAALSGWILWLLWRSPTFLSFSERYFIGLLLVSPIIHAWYFTWIVPFAVASRNLGTRLVSLSSVVYFMLPHRQGLGIESWVLSPLERSLLWSPFLLGLIWSIYRHHRRSHFGVPQSAADAT